MPFVLSCAQATFQRLMETVMSGLQWEMFNIFGRCLVVGKTFEDMIGNMTKVCDRIVAAGLKQMRPVFARGLLSWAYNQRAWYIH